MTELVNQGRLVYPKQVLGELKRRSGPSDLPLKWARENQGAAVKRVRMETVRTVLSRVPDVLDSTKTSGPEEADPYVLAMALELKTSGTPDVRVVTDDAKTTPLKMALSDAAGALGFPNVSLQGVPAG